MSMECQAPLMLAVRCRPQAFNHPHHRTIVQCTATWTYSSYMWQNGGQQIWVRISICTVTSWN